MLMSTYSLEPSIIVLTLQMRMLSDGETQSDGPKVTGVAEQVCGHVQWAALSSGVVKGRAGRKGDLSWDREGPICGIWTGPEEEPQKPGERQGAHVPVLRTGALKGESSLAGAEPG